jgi:hypothetical protein
MPKNLWDNIHEIKSPEDLPKSGDVTLQPVDDLAHAVPHVVKTEFGDLPHEYFRRLYERDPETEAQIPRLTSVPTRSAFLSDQSPNPESSSEPTEDRDLDVHNPSAHVQLAEHPDPYIERMARKVVAAYLLESNPQEIDLDSDRTKVAISLLELVKSTSALSKKNEPRCSPKLDKVRPKLNRYDFTVVCGESYSDPSGHEVKFKFLKKGNAKKVWMSRVLVSCSCPFWRYYGCDWNSNRKEYQERQMSDGSAPTVRGKTHLICKHIAACVPRVRLFVLRRK